MKLCVNTWVLLFCVTAISAHQTETIHPKITESAVTFIRENDPKSAYKEVYSFAVNRRPTNKLRPPEGPLFSGAIKWLTAAESVAQDENSPNKYPAFQHGPDDTVLGPVDMIDGVVWEDIEANMFNQRVSSHFYHAYTGKGLWLTGFAAPSRLRGEKFFAESVSLMGYVDELPFNRDDKYWRGDAAAPPLTGADEQTNFDKQLAYFMFGFSLHHAEDMSSVGHVHNDAHIDLNSAPRDDYEAVYIPYHAWNNNGKKPWYMQTNCASCGNVAVQSFEDIWPAPAAFSWGHQSLIRRIYNGSIFQAKIPDAGSSSFWNNDVRPSGELIDMFGYRELATGNGAYFTRLSPFASFSAPFILARDVYQNLGEWVLKAPNKIHEIGNSTSTDDIWPVQQIEPGNYYWYIEDHIPADASDGHKELSCENILTATNGIRKDLYQPYDRTNNGLVFNDFGGCHNTLLGRFANEFMPLAIRYSAEYTKWWFDIANTPPYLRRVTVTQEVKLAAPNGSSEPEKRKTKVYDARWRSVHAKGEYDETQWLNTSDYGSLAGNLRYRFPFRYVSKRVLKQNEKLDRGMLTSAFPIELLLEFNEPIQINANNGKCDPADGFHIGFQSVSKGSENGEDIWLSQYMSELGCEKSLINADDQEVANQEKDDNDRIWKVIIPVSVMDKFEALKKGGPMRLIVRAKDKNNHKGDEFIDFGEHAGTLDVHPNTPARRNVPREGAVRDPNTTFAWHKEKSTPDRQLFPGAKAGDFDYDLHEKDRPGRLGDRNHILLFSREADKTLFEDLNSDVTHDTVSTTLEPKKQENVPE